MKMKWLRPSIVAVAFVLPSIAFTREPQDSRLPTVGPTWDRILPAHARFELVMMREEAVLDKETGLVWERSPSDAMRNWHDASVACIQSVVGGRGGWRLPTIQELASLMDPAQRRPALPPGHPFDVVVGDPVFYWSASTIDSEPFAVWGINLDIGNVFALPKVQVRLGWCVRGVRASIRSKKGRDSR